VIEEALMPLINSRAERIASRVPRPAKLLVTATALTVAGCGAAGSIGPAASSARAFTQATYKYSACIRDHGLSNFPDPSMTDHNGQQIAYLAPSDALVASPAYKSANRACQAILPVPGDAQNAQSESEHRQQTLAFARCMRANDVSNFPDPDAQGQITPQMITGADVALHTPAVTSAAKSCLPSADGAITEKELQQALFR
jgi:hypothetical protein